MGDEALFAVLDEWIGEGSAMLAVLENTVLDLGECPFCFKRERHTLGCRFTQFFNRLSWLSDEMKKAKMDGA